MIEVRFVNIDIFKTVVCDESNNIDPCSAADTGDVERKSGVDSAVCNEGKCIKISFSSFIFDGTLNDDKRVSEAVATDSGSITNEVEYKILVDNTADNNVVSRDTK